MTEPARWDDLLALTHINYPDKKQEGMEACESLLSLANALPADMETLVRRNQSWHLPTLPSLIYTGPYYPEGWSREIYILMPAGWSRFNPSIAAGPDGELRMIVRSSNYVIDGDGRYVMPPDDPVIRTTNYLADVGDDLYLRNVSTIDDAHLRTDPPPFPVSGFEDARLFWRDGWKFSATVRDRHSSGICQQVMVSLDGSRAEKLRTLSGRQRHEKNWMPCTGPGHNGLETWVYSCHPTMLISIYDSFASGDWDDVGMIGCWRPAPYIARSFRGGSQAIPIPDGGYLALVHEAVNFDSPPHRVYQHRFVDLGVEADEIVGISLPFCFHGRGIEFAAGMAQQGDDLVISYGVDDARAYLMRVPLDRVLELLRDPLPEEL